MIRIALRIAVAMLAFALSMPSHAAFTLGNVLAAVGAGKVKEFTPTGTLVATYDTGTNSNDTTGMCFDAAGNLYVTLFTLNQVAKFDANGTLISGSFVSGLSSSPESCQVNQAGELVIGLEGSGGIRVHSTTTGAQLRSYTPNPTRNGWIDIAADQCTVFYADDTSTIDRYNICTSTQLPTFVTLGTVSGLRIIPGSGDVVASNRVEAVRVSAAGTVLGHFPAPSGNGELFAVTLDPDGQTFWTADLGTGNVFRYSLTNFGAGPITSWNSGALTETAGILVIGEITAGGVTPGVPTANLPVPTLSEWGLIALMLGLATVAGLRLRRR
jgi:hypothetical protein